MRNVGGMILTGETEGALFPGETEVALFRRQTCSNATLVTPCTHMTW